jgi:hypothetical protein
VSDVVLTARRGATTDLRALEPAPATRLHLTVPADATGPIDLAAAIPEPREAED